MGLLDSLQIYGLNPSFRGTYLLVGSKYIPLSRDSSRLNPSFRGTYLLVTETKKLYTFEIEVLILLFVELTFWSFKTTPIQDCRV